MDLKSSISFILKLLASPEASFILSFITGILIYSPDEFLTKLGLKDFKYNFHSTLGAIFLISLVFLIMHFIKFIFEKIRKKYITFKQRKWWVKRLRDLTPEEKEILSYYIKNNTRTQSLDFSNGVVKELEFYKIIYRASQLSRGFTVFDYNIQPWIWNYLKKHKELLE